MIGKQQTKLISRTLAPSLTRPVAEALLLFALGALAMFVHARFRWGNTNIPGHHGIEFMAILMACRINTRFKWSSVFMAIGIGSMIALPFMGFKNPIAALGYIFPVIVLDLMYFRLPQQFKHSWWLVIIGSLSYAVVPLYRILLTAFAGIPYAAAIKHGSLFVPIAGFLLFGALGSSFALGLSKTIKKKKNEKKA